MVPLLQELERKLARLPRDVQQRWVRRFLKELDVETKDTGIKSAERRWIAGEQPSQEQVAASVDQLKQFRKGRTLGADTTLRDLINEGRRL